MASVLIYSTPQCVYCTKAKEFLRARKQRYSEKDVGKDLDARKEMITISGQMGVPVIVVDDRVMVGFNPDMLSKALDK